MIVVLIGFRFIPAPQNINIEMTEVKVGQDISDIDCVINPFYKIRAMIFVQDEDPEEFISGEKYHIEFEIVPRFGLAFRKIENMNIMVNNNKPQRVEYRRAGRNDLSDIPGFFNLYFGIYSLYVKYEYEVYDMN